MNYNIQGKIDIEIDGKTYSYKLFDSLKLISKTKSQRKAGKELGISHSVLNRRIKNAEKNLGFDLVQIIGSKTYLTNEADKLIYSYDKYQSRIAENDKIAIAGGHIVTNFLDSISSELPYEIDVYSSDDETAYKLAKRGIVDILALDDPQLAFVNNLDFYAIGYDHLVLVSNDDLENKSAEEIDASHNNIKPPHDDIKTPHNNIKTPHKDIESPQKDIKKIDNLKNLKFVSVDGTAQRLAWDTLNENNIPFEIIKNVKSEFDAFKIVKNSVDLHTFLNASYFQGNEVLKPQTQHVISLVPINQDKKEIYDLIDYILGEGQQLVANEGFVPIKPWKTK